MEVTAIIDYGRGDEDFEMTLSNFDETVKVEAPQLFEGPIYMNRAELIQLLCSLDVAS